MTSIESAISDIEASCTQRGFIVGMEYLWVPEHGWTLPEEEEASADPFIQQYYAALQIFLAFFGIGQKLWVHLSAEMQAGKTGVVNCLIRLMLIRHNFLNNIGIRPEHIFLITGMNDNDWKEQTRERVPKLLRPNVEHNKGLTNIMGRLQRMYARDGTLRNILIICDESHIASKATNRPSKEIYEFINRCVRMEDWAAQNIRILTISATDPASILGMASLQSLSKHVILPTTEEYQSVKSLKEAGRIHDVWSLKDIPTVKKLVNFIQGTYGENAPLYHLIRPSPNQYALVEKILVRLVPGCSILPWDSKTKKKNRGTGAGEETSSVSSLEDINKGLLDNPPSKPTFILIKNMFYASKTLNDRYIGVLYDRVSGKDDTNLQSFLGRACGYGKSDRTHVFTSINTVENYLKTWLELRAREEVVVAGAKPADYHGKMPGVAARAHGTAGVVLGIDSARALPLQTGGAAEAVPRMAPAPRRPSVDQSLFEGEWSPNFATEDELRAWFQERGKDMSDFDTDEDGFWICSANGTKGRQRIEEIERLKDGNITTNMDPGKMIPGNLYFRRYVGYRDTERKETAFFVGRIVKKKTS